MPPSIATEQFVGRERREREVIADFQLPIVDLNRAAASTQTFGVIMEVTMETTITLETVQYSSLTDIDDVHPLCEDDYNVLTELRDILRKHEVTDRFGVCLLHRHFDLMDDEVVIESTDASTRVSTLAVAPRNSIKGRTIQTMWRFSQDRSIVAGTECRMECKYEDGGHKHLHPKVGV